jgi:hypothetical protein
VRKGVAFVVAGLLVARPGATETEVRKVGDKVDLRASTAPISEVLDRLARETGMKVTYDGAPPRARINVTLSGVTPVQAVVSILEGQGLNYALRMDPTSTKVETLMLVAGGGTAGPAAAPAPPARGQRAIERDPEGTGDTDEDPPPAEAQPATEEPPQRRPGLMPQFPGGMPAGPGGPVMPLTLPTPAPPQAAPNGPQGTPNTPQD